jgi:AsmA protein
VLFRSQLSGTLALAGPQLPLKRLELPIAGKLTADLAQNKADLALQTRVDDTRLDLKAALARFAPLALNFALDIDQLNVDRYLPPAKAEKVAQTASGGAQGATPAAVQADKIDLSPLQGLDVDGTLKIGQLQWRGLKLSALDLGLDLAGGRLQVAPLRGQLYGGTVDGRLTVDARTQQFSLRQHLRAVAIGPLLRDLAEQDVLDGRGSVTLDVTTRGDTVAILKRQLAGQAALDLRDGAVKGFNLAKLLRDAKAALTGHSGMRRSRVF